MPTETPTPISGRTNIRSLSQDQLAGELASLGAPSYRVKQVVDWVWKKGVTSFDQMTNLPASLRKELEERFVLGTTHEVTRQVSVDGSRKYLLELEDGVCVECVGMPSPSGRLAVCASTQAGCGMGCAFCATGAAGLARSLTADEIYDQVMHVSDDFASRVTSVVLMGQGEPFANYDATMAALRRLNSPDDGLGIGARHLTVSTCGVIPGITRFANEPEQFTLAISLHSAIQSTRNAIMPGVRRWSLVHLH
ncbi:MAG: 23S rRNA (adenine(2503)-C(2))-methyltransferase RlmN, partial [Atopobiaceae bacterium]|nr:23S rRNA (adenine(2503)-C(2))-methyltransferase RlmN [Atopobiaceae bacterium]